MTKSAVSSILKNINMNPDGRDRHSSAASCYYGDAERYRRSRTADNSQRSMDRYGRDQYDSSHSRGDVHHDRHHSSGSLDRQYQNRIAMDDHYGRRNADDRFMVHDGSSPADRMTISKDTSKGTTRRDEFKQGIYGTDRHMNDRFEQDYSHPSYDRQIYSHDYQPYDRFGYGRGYESDRMGHKSRYGVDRSHFEDRSTKKSFDQPGRVRFGGDRQYRNNDRRRSSSIARDDLPRRESRNTEDLRRAKSLPPRQSEESYYVNGPVVKGETTSCVTVSIEKSNASRTTSTKDEQESFGICSVVNEQARREPQGRQASLLRRESEKMMQSKSLSREDTELGKSEVQIEFEDREKHPLCRHESEASQQQLSRRESEARQETLSRRESESKHLSLSRRDSEGRHESLSRDESEGRQQSLSRRESEGRKQGLSSRETDDRQHAHSSRKSENLKQSMSRSESEGRQQTLSRRESEHRQQSISRRESEGRESENQSLSRRESEAQQQYLSRHESQNRQQSLSRCESEGRQQALSRRESESEKQSLSRRESEGRQQALSRRESESEKQSLSRRESEAQQKTMSRLESQNRQESLSRRESEGRQQALSRRESESEKHPLSRSESESRQHTSPRRDSESRQESLSGRESESQQYLSKRQSGSDKQSLSMRDSDGIETSLPIRDKEAHQELLSSCELDEVHEQSSSRRASESCKQSLSRRGSEGKEQSLSRRESDVREHSLSRRESTSGPLARRQSEELQLSSSKSESNEAEKLERSRRSSEKNDQSRSRKSSVAAEVPSIDDTQDIKMLVPTGLRSRSQSRSLHGSERGDGQQEMHRDEVEFAETCDRHVDNQEKSQVRKTVQFGSRFGRDRMPAPIPPFSEPRSTYPASKDHTTRNKDCSSVHSRELAVRATYDIMRRRYYERSVDPSLNPTWFERGENGGSSYNVSQITEDVLKIEDIDFRCSQNAVSHETSDYEIVNDLEQPNPIFRRGKTFIMDMTFRDRAFEERRDNMYLNFYFGPNPSVPKRTRVVLPIRFNSEFERVPHQWDSRVISQENNTVSVEVSMPVSCPVGMWRCVVETSTKEDTTSRLQYRCAEDVYVIFNPFEKDDAVYMGDAEQRQEFVMKDSGKIYTGGYRNVSGRPWIFGQFDDCVLPAACVLLEMSGLSYAERGNAVKVTKALASMIKSSRLYNEGTSNICANGLVEEKYDDSYNGGNSPHLWSGSVQIIEEFLKRGATPVKYGQCWVMTGLMTTLCRALGLPARAVTGFVSAVGTQDTLTADRFVDRFGDIEDGPSCNQSDSLWSFRTWCEVWMHRADQITEYSGWQATDPCRTFRDGNGDVKGSCGPCPVEALRRGDVGQRDDVDAFFSSMNAYVRYFYEDEESGWGYSPFRQFKYPVTRYVLTKTVGRFDDKGDDDCEDITSTYRDEKQTDKERFSTFNSCRGLKDLPSFEYQAAAHNLMQFYPKDSDDRKFDVKFELEMPERVMIGQAITIPVIVTNNSAESRTMQTNICTRSSFYTGSLASYLKRSSTQLTLDPDQSQTVHLTLDPVDYENKLFGMAYIKITVTGFVQETGQSFIDELDFRFNKPCLKIETSDMKFGVETEAEFSFTNPLDVPLTDCHLTMEVSGSVRPRTIRINRDVRPRESFTLRHSFANRTAGERHLVACFASRQLSDVVGHRSVMVHE